MEKAILNFLEKFGTKVLDDEKSDFVELMMDDHHCIEFLAVQYYIPENNSEYTEDDELIVMVLDGLFHV